MKKFFKFVGAALAAVTFSTVAASAATTTLDFSSGTTSGATYTQGMFTVTVVDPASLSIANNCPSPFDECLKLSNNQSATITYAGGGAFDLLDFVFDGKDGESGAMAISYIFDDVVYSYSPNMNEDLNASTMTLASNVGFTGLFGVTSVTFLNIANGSLRIDELELSAVPLPASGLLLLGAFGGFAALRRRKAQAA